MVISTALKISTLTDVDNWECLREWTVCSVYTRISLLSIETVLCSKPNFYSSYVSEKRSALHAPFTMIFRIEEHMMTDEV